MNSPNNPESPNNKLGPPKDQIIKYYDWLNERMHQKASKKLGSKANTRKYKFSKLGYSLILPTSQPVSPIQKQKLYGSKIQQDLDALFKDQTIIQVQSQLSKDPMFEEVIYESPMGNEEEEREMSTNLQNIQIDRSTDANQNKPIKHQLPLPDDLTTDQFISLYKSSNPYMKYQQLAKIQMASNYRLDFEKKQPLNVEILNLNQFTLQNSVALPIQSVQRTDYKYHEPQQIVSVERKNNGNITGITNWNSSNQSEYNQQYKVFNSQLSNIFKPQDNINTFIQLSERNQSEYAKSFDARNYENFLPIPTKSTYKNYSNLNSLIANDALKVTDESNYQKAFKLQKMNNKILLNEGRSKSQFSRHHLPYIESFQGQYTSTTAKDYKKYQIPQKEQGEDLVKLIGIIQKRQQ